MPPVATWLDLAWLGVALSCLLAHCFRENHRQQTNGRIIRATAVLVILVFVFPFLSASDDLIGLALLAPRDPSRTEAASPGPFDALAGARVELGIRLQKLAFLHTISFHLEPDTLYTLASIAVPSRVFPWAPAPRQASRPPPSQ